MKMNEMSETTNKPVQGQQDEQQKEQQSGNQAKQNVGGTPDNSPLIRKDVEQSIENGDSSDNILDTDSQMEQAQSEITQTDDGIDVKKLQEENERLNREVKNQYDQIIAIVEQHQALVKENDDLQDIIDKYINSVEKNNNKKAIDKANADIVSLRMQNADLLRKFNFLKSNYDLLTKQIIADKERIAELEQNIQTLNADKGLLYDEGIEIKNENKQLNQQITDQQRQFQEKLEAEQKRRAQAEANKQQLQTQFQGAQTTINILSNENNELKTTLQQTQGQAEADKQQLQQQLEEQQRLASENAAVINDQKDLLSQAERAIDKAHQDISDRDAQIDVLNQQLEAEKGQSEINKMQLQDQIDNLNSQLEMAQTRIDEKDQIILMRDQKIAGFGNQLQQSYVQEQQLQTENNQLALEKDELLEKLQNAQTLNEALEQKVTILKTRNEEVSLQLQYGKGEKTRQAETISKLEATLQQKDVDTSKMQQKITELQDQIKDFKTEEIKQGTEIADLKKKVKQLEILNGILKSERDSNLKRANGVLGTNGKLKTQIVELNKQISQYKRITERLQKQIETAQAKDAEQSKIITTQQGQLQQSEQALEKATKQVEKQNKDLERVQQEKEQLEQQLKQQQGQIEVLKKQLTDSDSKIQDLDSKIKEINTEKEQLAKQEINLKDQINSLESAIRENEKKNEEELGRKQSEVDKLKTESSVKDKTLADQQRQLTALRGQLATNQKIQREKEEENRRVSDEKTKLELEKKDLEGQLQQKEQQIGDLTKQSTAQGKQVIELRESIEKLKKQNNDLVGKIGHQEEELKKNDDKFKDLQAEYQRQSEQFQAEQRRLGELERRNQQLQDQLDTREKMMAIFESGFKKQIEDLHQQSLVKQKQIEDDGQALQQMNVERIKALREKQQLTQQLEEQQRLAIENATAAEAKHQEEISEKDAENAKLRQQNQQQAEQVEQLQQQNRSKQKSLNDSVSSQSKLQSQNRELHEDLITENRKRKQAEADKQRLQEQLEELEEEEQYKLMQAGASAIIEQGKREQVAMSQALKLVKVKQELMNKHEYELSMKNRQILNLEQQLAKQNTQNEKLKEEIKKYQDQDKKRQDQEIEGFFANVNEIQEQTERTVKTIELKIGDNKFPVELSDIKLDGKELSGEKLATSFKEIFGKDKPVEVADIFKKANEYVNENNEDRLKVLYGILNGLSGNNDGLKKAILNDKENTLEEFKTLNDNLKKYDNGERGLDGPYNKFRMAVLVKLSVVGEMQKAMDFANILGMEFVKDNTVEKEVQTEEIQNEVGAVQTEASAQTENEVEVPIQYAKRVAKKDIENEITPQVLANASDEIKMPEPQVQIITMQQGNKMVEKNSKSAETQTEQQTQPEQPTPSTNGIVLNTTAAPIIADEKNKQQDLIVQGLNPQEQSIQVLNKATQTTSRNNTVEKSETFVYYKCIQEKEGKKEDIGLKTELGNGDVEGVTFPIELQIEGEKATLGEVVAYAKSVLESVGKEVNPDNVMKMLDLQGRNIGEDQLKTAKISIANEIKKFADSKENGLTEEKLREEADKNQDYNQVVDRIAEKTKRLAEIKKKELGDRMVNKMRESAEVGENVRKELVRREERSRQSQQGIQIEN